MRSTLRSTDESTQVYETKSDFLQTSHDVPSGEAIGGRSEDHDLSQFGYKAELEVKPSFLLSMKHVLTCRSGALGCGP